MRRYIAHTLLNPSEGWCRAMCEKRDVTFRLKHITLIDQSDKEIEIFLVNGISIIVDSKEWHQLRKLKEICND